MKNIVIDNTKSPVEIQDSQCYRRSNAPCSNSCPFFEIQTSTPYGDVVVLTCNTYQIILSIIGYTS